MRRGHQYTSRFSRSKNASKFPVHFVKSDVNRDRELSMKFNFQLKLTRENVMYVNDIFPYFLKQQGIGFKTKVKTLKCIIEQNGRLSTHPSSTRTSALNDPSALTTVPPWIKS